MNEFVEYIVDLLSPYGNIRSRAMFGGHALYMEGLIVGIIVDEELYFKTDAISEKDYEAMGAKPLTYNANNSKIIKMPYSQVPLDIMEDEELLGNWLTRAYDVSLTAKSKKT